MDESVLVLGIFGLLAVAGLLAYYAIKDYVRKNPRPQKVKPDPVDRKTKQQEALKRILEKQNRSFNRIANEPSQSDMKKLERALAKYKSRPRYATAVKSKNYYESEFM